MRGQDTWLLPEVMDSTGVNSFFSRIMWFPHIVLYISANNKGLGEGVGARGPGPSPKTLTHENPRVHHGRALALGEDHEGVDVQFLDFREVQDQLGEPFQARGNAFQVRGGAPR